MLSTLLISTLLFFLLTSYSIVQSNLNWFHLSETKFWTLKILDTGSAATLFVTLVGALLVRHQFAISVLPRINYVSGVKQKQIKQKSNEPLEIWQVEIRNTGLGSAIIESTDYHLDLAVDDIGIRTFKLKSLIEKLAEVDLIRDTDYNLFNMSSGFSLSPKDEYVVFEIQTKHIPKINRLTMALYFKGQLGDKYCREISLINASKE